MYIFPWIFLTIIETENIRPFHARRAVIAPAAVQAAVQAKAAAAAALAAVATAIDNLWKNISLYSGI